MKSQLPSIKKWNFHFLIEVSIHKWGFSLKDKLNPSVEDRGST